MKRPFLVLGVSIALVIAACGDDDAPTSPQLANDAGPVDASTDRTVTDSGTDSGSDAGSDGGSDAGDAAPLAITVSGKIIAYGEPRSNVAVVIGGKSATTSTLGTFSIADVKPPYDVAFAISPSEVTIYQGLSRPDPVLIAFGKGGLPLPTARSAASLVGQVGGGPGLPFVDQPVVTASGPQNASGFALATAADGTYAMATDPTWYGSATTISVKVHATLLSGGLGYYGFVDNVTVNEGSTPGNVNIALNSVGVATLTAKADGPADLSGEPAKMFYRGGILLTANGGGYQNPASGALPFTVERKFPKVPGATLYSEAYYDRFSAAGERSSARASAPIGDTATVTASLVDPPRPTAPAEAATGIAIGSELTFSAFTGGVHRVTFTSVAAAAGPVVHVLTAASKVKLPDLSALTLSIPKGTAYTWRVHGYAPATSMDDSALPGLLDSPDGNLPPVAAVKTGSSAVRTFTTAP